MITPRFCDAILTPAAEAALPVGALVAARRAAKLLLSPENDFRTDKEEDAPEAEDEKAAGRAWAMLPAGSVTPEAAAAHAMVVRRFAIEQSPRNAKNV